MLKIHKEGQRIISISAILIVLAGTVLTVIFYTAGWYLFLVWLPLVLLLAFLLRFFRVPDRPDLPDDDILYSPADGKVVVIEESEESEYFKDRRIQVSVFMSVWDVHINFFPFSGKVLYYKYHPGKYLVALNPKSSILNERTSVVVENKRNVPVLLRQIAGAVARRIICNAKPGESFKAGDEMGFIKFGSRVDIFLPPGTEILVKRGDQVFGKHTPIARIR